MSTFDYFMKAACVKLKDNNLSENGKVLTKNSQRYVEYDNVKDNSRIPESKNYSVEVPNVVLTISSQLKKEDIFLKIFLTNINKPSKHTLNLIGEKQRNRLNNKYIISNDHI